MILLPSVETPHYQCKLSFVVPKVYDRRGVSIRKTRERAESLTKLTMQFAASLYYGSNYHLIDEINFSCHYDIVQPGYKASVFFDLPSAVEPEELRRSLVEFWNSVGGQTAPSYLSVKRHYTAREIEDSIW